VRQDRSYPRRDDTAFRRCLSVPSLLRMDTNPRSFSRTGFASRTLLTPRALTTPGLMLSRSAVAIMHSADPRCSPSNRCRAESVQPLKVFCVGASTDANYPAGQALLTVTSPQIGVRRTDFVPAGCRCDVCSISRGGAVIRRVTWSMNHLLSGASHPQSGVDY
jgi:hypothetical protein